jgi:hypothetical protein
VLAQCTACYSSTGAACGIRQANLQAQKSRVDPAFGVRCYSWRTLRLIAAVTSDYGRGKLLFFPV